MINSSPHNARNYLYYSLLLAVFGAGISFILATGSKLNARRSQVSLPNESLSATTPPASAIESATPQTDLSKVFKENLRSPLSILLLQIIVILVAAKLFAELFRRIGQPPVMGEMVAGIVLGPSVVGLFSLQTMAFIFPLSSMATLGLLSQIGWSGWS